MQSGSTPTIQDYYKGIDVPTAADLQVQLEELVLQGSLSPEQAQAILVERSAMEDVNVDPTTRQAQMDALAQLQDITSNGGLTAIEKSKMNQIQSEENVRARGAREAILQNAQARGMGGSGLELMSQMQNQQDAATRTSQRNLDVSAMMQERALQALMSQGQLAGQIGQQGFDQAAQKAGAQDAIAKFNAQNRQNTEMANVSARNDAQARNLAAKQGVADTNVATRNQQQNQNVAAKQQAYQNQLNKASGQTNVATANANNAGKDSQGEADSFNKTLGTIASVGAMFLSDEREKTDVEEFNASDFLDSLTPHKFNYKNPKLNGSKKHVGVMAQDLEKTDAGSKLVHDTPEGKMVDYSQAGPTILASLADLNRRLREMEDEEQE